MSTARTELLDRVVADVAARGLGDRSLREVASAVGTSHRMLLYHFGSRAGLTEAVVHAVEAAQRDLLLTAAAEATSPAALVRLVWARVSSPEMQPFVRLFYECVGTGATAAEPWLEVAEVVVHRWGVGLAPDDVRLGVAVTRGLLVDVLATGDVEAATRSLERFVQMWSAVEPGVTGP